MIRYIVFFICSNNSRKIFLFFIFAFLHTNSAFAQNQTKIDSLLQELKAKISNKEKVDIYNLLADEYDNVDSSKTAYYANKAITLAKPLNYYEGISNAYYEIGWATAQLGYYDEAYNIYNKVLEFAQKSKYAKGKSNAYNGLALVYKKRGEYSKSLKHFSKALELRIALGNKKGAASCYGNIGELYREQGNFPKALENYLHAWKIADELKDKIAMSQAYHYIGMIYDDLYNYPMAIDHYHKALAIYEELGNKRGIALIYNNLAISYRHQENITLSLEYYFKALKIAKELGDNSQICIFYNNIGNLNLSLGKYNEGISYTEKAFHLSKKINDHNITSSSLNILGRSHYKLKNYDLAKQFLLQGIELSTKFGYPTHLRNSAEALAIVEKELGNYKAALASYELYHATYDSLLGKEKAKQLSQLQVQYETEKKEQEIKNLAQQTAIQSLELKQANFNKTIFSILSVVLLLLGVVLYLVNRQKQLALKQKAQDIEQNLLRVQMNPHFIFNAMTSIQDYMNQGNAKQASLYLVKFSKLIRQVLDNSRSELISLDQEINMLDNYLSIQNLKRDHPFTFKIKVEKNLIPDEIAIPPMFAQPFVENAIEHGVTWLKEEATITIHFSLEKDHLVLKISDNGPGIEEAMKIKRKDHVSHAIKITEERIDLYRKMQKKKIAFDIQNLSHGTLVTFNLPFQYI